MQMVDVRTQYLAYRPQIDAAIQRVLEHGKFILGPEMFELEATLAAYVGAAHCITVASGTDSLEIALRALNIGPGDEVITVPFTWISTAEAIALVGARPVFVDIERSSFNMDARLVEAAITPRTKAIMPVSLFGQMADFDVLNAIAEKHGLVVIEDAAQSFGAEHDGCKSCAATRVGSTSFFPAKPLGCFGDGGALFTSDDKLADSMRAIRTHGGLERHHHPLLGMNGRFDTLQAAVLLAKFPHFQEEISTRSRLADRYSRALGTLGVIPEVMPGNRHVYAQYTLRVARRDAMAAHLLARGIPTGIYYPKCLHEQPVFAPLGYGRGDFPVAEAAAKEVISLPLHPYLSDQDQDRVVEAVQEFQSAQAISFDFSSG